MIGIPLRPPACAAFDELAPTYDQRFTRSKVGRAQRDVVWAEIDRTWKAGDLVLELNCGTGEDALHLACNGVQVLACDGSARMIDIALRRRAIEDPATCVNFIELTTEEISAISETRNFDGVLSNFSGFNCVADLRNVAMDLSALTRPGAEMLACLSTRFCAWEFIWYLTQANFKQAFRRWPGEVETSVAGRDVHVWYPTVSTLKKTFSPWFSLECITGVGIFVPPSYAEQWVSSHPQAFRFLCWIDRYSKRLPGFRIAGDHMLLRFRRCDA